MKEEYLCILHTDNKCESRGYHEEACDLGKKSEYATCEYRLLTQFPLVVDQDPSIVDNDTEEKHEK